VTYFNYEEIARRIKMPEGKLKILMQAIREEFPHDEMMYELHLMIVCLAIEKGYITVEEALRSKEAA